MMRAIDAGTSTLGEPVLQPSTARIVLERGFAVIEEPFTPEDPCRRLTGVLASRPNLGASQP